MPSVPIMKDEEDRHHREQQRQRQSGIEGSGSGSGSAFDDDDDDHNDHGDDHVINPTTARPRKRSRSLPDPVGKNIKIRRRRHLVVPQTDEELDTMVDAYCSYCHWQADGDSDGEDKNNKETTKKKGGHGGEKASPWEDLVVSALKSSLAFDDFSSRLGCKRSSHDTTTTATTNVGTTTNTKIQFDPNRTPLMRKFYNSIGVDPDSLQCFNDKVEERQKSNDDAAPSSSTAPSSSSSTLFSQHRLMGPQVDVQDDKDDIDNPENSTLRPGQHRRYLQLLRQHNFRVAVTEISSIPSSKNHQLQQNVPLAQRTEFKKLHRQVVSEQERYRQALDRFHLKHRSRYLIGFSSPCSCTVISHTDVNKGLGDNVDHQSSSKTTTLKDHGINSTQQRRQGYEEEQAVDNRLRAFSQWACHQMSRKAEQVWKKIWIDDEGYQKLYNIEPEQLEVTARTDGKTNTDLRFMLPRTYGPTRQIISLSSPTATASAAAHEYWLDIYDLNFECIPLELDEKDRHRDVEDSSLLDERASDTLLAATLSIGKIIPPPTHCAADKLDQTLLRYDSNAIYLAMKHSCKILTTIETLEEMLHLPGQPTTDWMITTTSTNHGKLRILDLPLIRPFSSPRACLEYSFRNSLYQMCNESNDEYIGPNKMTSNNVPDENHLIRYQYFVLTVPPLSPPGTRNIKRCSQDHQKMKVLVRVPVYKATIGPSSQAVILQPHLEYFADQGRPKEMMDGYERAVVILKLAVFGPSISSLFVRIDPITCQILACDIMTIPKAISAPQGATMNNPIPHIQNMVQILYSVLTLGDVDSILCLPGRHGQDRLDPYSISVHACIKVDKLQRQMQQQQQQQEEKPISVNGSTVSVGTIDLVDVLEKSAGTVRLGDQAVSSCRRDWIWDNDGQIPDTFPPRDNENSGTESTKVTM